MKLFYLPDLGEGLPEAEIHQWYVAVGEEVKAGDRLVSVETAKAIVDIPAPYNGHIVQLYGNAGDIIKTGAPLVGFEGDDSVSVVGHLETTDEILTESPGARAARPQKAAVSNTSSNPIKVMPAVRALASKLNVDLNQIHPTGADGKITLEDVEQAKTNHLAVPEGMELLKGPRRIMATVMTQAHAEAAPVTLMDEADIHHWPLDADVTVRLMRAIMVACRKEPNLNAWFDGKKMTRRLLTDVNIGIAVDSPEGLFVPVIHAAQNYSDGELRNKINTLKEQVKTRKVAPADLKGSSIMLSNFGTIAGRYATPILVPPTVAILGVGRQYEAVIPIDGAPTIRRLLPLSLTCDHRAVSGAEVARFLAAFMAAL